MTNNVKYLLIIELQQMKFEIDRYILTRLQVNYSFNYISNI